MNIKIEEDMYNDSKVYTVTVPNRDIAHINFDQLDSAVIAEKAEHGSDVLQSLQIIFFRYEQQFGSRK